MNWRICMRKGHRWGAIVIAAPFLLVLATGLLLQIKKQWSWVQPPTQRGSAREPTISFAAILQQASSVSQTSITGWQDIDRLDVQPGRGIVKVLTRNRWEVQLDLATGEVLQVAYRRSDLIESLHDGSWFHEGAKLGVFLPVALIVLGLWVSGIYLFFLPWTVRWRRRRENKVLNLPRV